jgi:hypothetical protein
MAHLPLSVFFSFSFYTYKDQSKFIFRTTRQQTTSTVAPFFHHLLTDNLNFLETISPRAADCVWPGTWILACLLSLVIGYRVEHKLLDRYISISILLNREKSEERCRLYPNSTCRQTCMFVGTNKSLVLYTIDGSNESVAKWRWEMYLSISYYHFIVYTPRFIIYCSIRETVWKTMNKIYPNLFRTEEYSFVLKAELFSIWWFYHHQFVCVKYFKKRNVKYIHIWFYSHSLMISFHINPLSIKWSSFE